MLMLISKNAVSTLFNCTIYLEKGIEKMKIDIREANIEDCEAIFKLNKNEMGYDYDLENTRERLTYILQRPNHKIFVAEINNQVVGYVHGNDYDLIYKDSLKNIMGIAVDHRYKRNGIGKKLMNEIENWAFKTGAVGVRLLSGEERISSHEFYKSCGYVNKKDQKNFIKIL